ncbi:MAG: flagellar biosynthesis anti-sigma factor FlgM [Terriglobales bacterium]|jgi:flagellar biosynthesis anti-sigma factor FlgM
MRVDFTTFATEPPESGKPGRSGQTGTAGAASTADAVESGGSNSTASSTNASAIDQARFSFDQTRVQSLQAQVLAQPEVRATKVQALQTSIENGNYSVPPSQVADAIVSELAG